MSHFAGSVCKECCIGHNKISGFIMKMLLFLIVFFFFLSVMVLVICENKDCSFLENIVVGDLVPNFLMNTSRFKFSVFQ